MHSSTRSARIPARRIASAATKAPSSVAGRDDNFPWNLPVGVRTADAMTTSLNFDFLNLK
jgi:hypothetical protein